MSYPCRNADAKTTHKKLKNSSIFEKKKMNDKNFNKKVKELRKKKEISQDELAKLTGLSLRTIQRIEKGETNPLGDTKRRIINILETFSDTDICNKSSKIETDDFLRKMILEFKYPFILNVVSLLCIAIGFSGIPWLLFLGLIVGFFSFIILAISTFYILATSRFKKGFINLLVFISMIFIYFIIISFFVFGKTVIINSENGVTTKIERNMITGKSDTTIVEPNYN